MVKKDGAGEAPSELWERSSAIPAQRRSIREVIMSAIDKRRIAAVATLQSLGYTFSLVDWLDSAEPCGHFACLHTSREADAMHALLSILIMLQHGSRASVAFTMK